MQMCRLGSALSLQEATQLVQALASLADKGHLPVELLTTQKGDTKAATLSHFDASRRQSQQAAAGTTYSSLGQLIVGLVSKFAEDRGAAGLLAAAARLVVNQGLDPGFRQAVAGASGHSGKEGQGQWHVYVPPQEPKPDTSASSPRQPAVPAVQGSTQEGATGTTPPALPLQTVFPTPGTPAGALAPEAAPVAPLQSSPQSPDKVQFKACKERRYRKRSYRGVLRAKGGSTVINLNITLSPPADNLDE
jgi:hypothetical protein